MDGRRWMDRQKDGQTVECVHFSESMNRQKDGEGQTEGWTYLIQTV